MECLTQATLRALEVVRKMTLIKVVAELDHGQMEER